MKIYFFFDTSDAVMYVSASDLEESNETSDDLFADNTYADACLDRIVHKAYRLELNGKNMRNPG